MRTHATFHSLKITLLMSGIMLALHLASGQCLAPPNGLIGWWRGDGNANDLIGGNNGILRNGPAFTASGKVGSAFNFFGTIDCVEVPHSNSLITANYTVETWVKPSAQVSDVANQDLIFGQNGGMHQLLARTGTTGVRIVSQFRSGNNFPEVASSTEIPIGQFSHLAGTWDGTTLRLYVNGVLNAQSIPGGGLLPVDSGCSFFIGGFYNPSVDHCNYVGQFFNGIIDEVSIYNRALSSNEIASIYAADSAGKCPVWFTAQPQSQIGYWGQSVTFKVSVGGAPPFGYQWYFGANQIPNATNTSLVLTNLQFTNAGTYYVVVTNYSGSYTSNPANLAINPAGVAIALYPGVKIDGVVGLTYGIQYSTNLSNPSGWIGLTNLTFTQQTEIWYDSIPASRPQRFYLVLPGPIPIP